ncbi:hypothetical protein MATL_G00221420 [Megalops atlanticus]|uniref:Ig-like domain-containing protein n=1 Tax=Megalops atlanticus TaxID=7932 RepID=A0A9D3PJ43_MEGAT|nr:hypothetical protein MATL_G00221420 [Megalops atlanticus]
MRHYNGTLSKFLVQLKVYITVGMPNITRIPQDPVSEPVISNITQNHSVSKSCSVLCSVENGREVTLSWQREGETLNHTSSPDLNTPLSLPLRIEEHNYTYICVAANPVSEESLQLNTEDFCPETQGRGPSGLWVRVGVGLGVVMLGVLVLVVIFCKGRCRTPPCDAVNGDNVPNGISADGAERDVQIPLTQTIPSESALNGFVPVSAEELGS